MAKNHYVNLNVNPCKMCMPMGAAMAFKGIESSMFMLHGSQGCSTYIRRHMAGHYNEPIDIGSSSLNEEGTVYGGSLNLKKGLSNIIRQYRPRLIGVATTCLAETIGEDISRIIHEFCEEESIETHVIPVSTPGYGGTEYEGYFAALHAIVQTTALDSTPHPRVNIIANTLNPGDVRNIKSILHAFGLEYILLPDISETLDGVYTKEYQRIPAGGTPLEDIRKMAGAAATIEMGYTVPARFSPGEYLQDHFQVPLYRCSLPIGIQETDKFIQLLAMVSGNPVPPGLLAERGRLMDGMIDSHKYHAHGRAVIYGQPEWVYSISTLCAENGIQPVLIATGARSALLRELLQAPEYADVQMCDDTDFRRIQELTVSLQANLLIGSSEGKFVTEKTGIPLVRIGFPIHDRMGGQRKVCTGYTGSLQFLDEITNTLLEYKTRNYRMNMLETYGEVFSSPDLPVKLPEKTIAQKTEEHPCYNPGACANARMHLPVAPACNLSCNYCSRKFDCPNESRPGVTSAVLTPEEAAEKFMHVQKKLKNLKVIGIAGPGDALANFAATRRSIQLIREITPDITICLSTNGLMLPYYAKELVELGVRHVTITINAVDPRIGASIYKEIRYLGITLTGEEGAGVLIANQLAGLQFLASQGVVCKVNIVFIKGINDTHIEEVVFRVKECGAYMTNIMPLIPAPGSRFETMEPTNHKELHALRKRCGEELRQMYHCQQCRADAIGLLEKDCHADFDVMSGGEEGTVKEEQAGFPLYAVASKTGSYIDEHFGHAGELLIYSYDGNRAQLVARKTVGKYCQGEEECDDEEDRLESAVKAVEGCQAILVHRIGYHPMKKLQEKNILVIQTAGTIEEGIRYAIEQMAVAAKR